MLKPNQKYVTDAGFQEGSLNVSLHFFSLLGPYYAENSPKIFMPVKQTSVERFYQLLKHWGIHSNSKHIKPPSELRSQGGF